MGVAQVRMHITKHIEKIPMDESVVIQTLQVHIVDAGAPTIKMQTPVDLHMLIDRSRSMSHQKKIRMAEEAARNIVEKSLSIGSRFSLSLFSDDIDTQIDDEEIKSDSDRKRIADMIQDFKCFGWTRMHSALTEIQKWATRKTLPNKRLILITDGRPTDEKNLDGYHSISDIFLKTGVPIDTIALGKTHRLDIMDKLCTGTRGKYVYLREEDATLLTPATRDLTIAISDATVIAPELRVTFDRDGELLEDVFMFRPVVMKPPIIGGFPTYSVAIRTLEKRSPQTMLLRMKCINPNPGAAGTVRTCNLSLVTQGNVIVSEDVYIDYIPETTPVINPGMEAVLLGARDARAAKIKATQMNDPRTYVDAGGKETSVG